MRVLLSTYGSRGDVEPLVALAARLRRLGAEVRVCAPPDDECAESLAGVGVPLVPVGESARSLMHGETPPSAADLARRRVEMVAEQFDTVAAAAEGCDALVAAGLMQVAARSVAEKRRIRYVYASYQPVSLPSPHHPPPLRPGWSPPPEGADNQVLWDQDALGVNELFAPALNTHRASIGLPAVDDVRGHVFTGHPWLAADPVLGPWQETAGLDVVQTGAWVRQDTRPLPDELEAFLDAGDPPVYVGFGSMRAPEDIARVAVEAVRARGRRALVSRGWAGLTLTDEGDDCFAVGEVNHQALFGRVAAVVHHGGAGTTTNAARAGAPQVVVPQMVDQPYWAGRVAGLGIGAAHDGPTPTVGSLSAALGVALAPGTRARAAEVAGTVRTDGADAAARLLLDAVGRGGPPVSV
ncbi:glycosyltransferase [Streptomyces sp. NRRL F-5135]|uniref:glycosyltransferase n=1 Tax=Streptomyces sp. NRRL F-5135 TaxID=1463858 RepID=UPI0004CBD97D|nr:glycosyltransferase [Streptomyces sp. NRRL F-5135]